MTFEDTNNEFTDSVDAASDAGLCPYCNVRPLGQWRGKPGKTCGDDDCKTKNAKATRQTYYQNPRVMEKRRKYYDTEKWKKYHRERNKTPEVKEKRRIYNQLPTSKQRKREYYGTPQWKDYMREYAKTPKEKEKRREYNQRPEVKVRIAAYQKTPHVRKKINEYRKQWEKTPKGKASLATHRNAADVEICVIECQNKCIYCNAHVLIGNQNDSGAIGEHIDPSIKGTAQDGTHNWVLSCRSCNSSKHDKNMIVWLDGGGNPHRTMRPTKEIIADMERLGKTIPPKPPLKKSD